jgi:hypothetical protein
MPKKTVTKKTTKKQTAKKSKAVQLKLKREEQLVFTVDTPEQAAEIAAHLSQLEVTTGWIFLKQMLMASMDVIERQIITKKDIDTGQLLTEDEVDSLRKSYLAYEELIDKPAQLIENLTQGNRPTSPEYDPYSRVTRKDTETIDAGVLADDD